MSGPSHPKSAAWDSVDPQDCKPTGIYLRRVCSFSGTPPHELSVIVLMYGRTGACKDSASVVIQESAHPSYSAVHFSWCGMDVSAPSVRDGNGFDALGFLNVEP